MAYDGFQGVSLTRAVWRTSVTLSWQSHILFLCRVAPSREDAFLSPPPPPQHPPPPALSSPAHGPIGTAPLPALPAPAPAREAVLKKPWLPWLQSGSRTRKRLSPP